MRKNMIFQIGLILSVLILSTLLLRTCKSNDLLKQQKKASVDTTVLKRNNKGQLEASKLVYQAQNLMEAKAEIERLKVFESKFTRQTKQLTSLKKEFEILKSGSVIKPKTDTVYIANVMIDTPSINIDTGDQFHRLKFASNKSKYAYEIRLFDESELKVDNEGRKGTKVTLLNKNPYVVSADLKSVMIPPKNPSLFNKIIFYAGLGLGIGVVIFK